MKLTYEEKLQRLYKAVAEHLSKEIRAKMPETGSFRKIFVTANYDKSGLRGMVSAEPSYQGDDMRVICVGAFRNGEDRIVSNYLFTGTKEAVLAWLESLAGVQEIIEAYAQLEKKVKTW